ncbi:MAG: hypothetical protein WA843_00050 [Candidatus Saccharimonadales bacterium]
MENSPSSIFTVRKGITHQQRRSAKTNFYLEGFSVLYVIDEPRTEYPLGEPHALHVYSLFGWAALWSNEGDRQIIHPNQRITIEAGVLHDVVTGDNGWGYLKAWEPREAGAHALGRSLE